MALRNDVTRHLVRQPGVRPFGMVPQPASLFDGNAGAPGLSW